MLALTLAAIAAACGGGGSGEPLVVLAASSLTDVLPTVIDAYEEESGTTVTASFAGSSTLREQILDGVEADVFVSANPAIMAELAQVGLLRDAVVPVASNAIVVAVPLGNPADVGGIEAFGDDALVIGLCATEVPCGELGAAVLDDAAINPAVDTFEPSVRSLLGKVELGEVDAALVYDTDVISSELVDSIGEPFREVGQTTYVAASLLGGGTQAEDFVDFLTGDVASLTFDQAGFGPS